MRGGYTAGVLDAFLDLGIEFPRCVGVSAGACNALSYIAKQQGRYYRANTEYLHDKRYMGLWSLIHTGYLFGNRFVFDDITFDLVPLDVEGFLRESPNCPLTVVTTDVRTGLPRYDVIDDFLNQMCLVEASSSLPLLSPMIPYEGTLLMDGGISDSIPVRHMLEQPGCARAVVILTQHRAYRKTANRMMPLIRLTYRKFPALCRALEHRHEAYNATLDEIAQLEQEGRVFVIRPQKPVEIGRMERSVPKIAALYEEGYREAMAAAEALTAFLSQTGASSRE